MVKSVVILITILLALVSASGYAYLSAKIAAGERNLNTGQLNIDTESPSLMEGKADLAHGKRQLAEGKKEYEHAHDNPFLVWADRIFNDGKGFAEGRKKIAAGEAKIAEGQNRVDVGEKRLDAGNLAMRQGTDELQLGLEARDCCALAAIAFTMLSLVLGVFWRRSLVQTFMHLKTKF